MFLSCIVSKIQRDTDRKMPILSYSTCSALPLGVTPLKFRHPGATVQRGLRDPMFSCFGTIPACDGWTDGWIDKQKDIHMTTAYTAIA